MSVVLKNRSDVKFGKCVGTIGSGSIAMLNGVNIFIGDVQVFKKEGKPSICFRFGNNFSLIRS